MNHPPKFAAKLLNYLLAEEWKDEVIGDLEEQYEDNLDQKGKIRAGIIYWYETVKFLKPYLFSNKTQNITIMLFLNYIRISYRNLVKNKMYSSVNILGLALGLSSVMLISLYLMYQLSFDQFYPNKERIFRVALERIYPDRVKTFGSSPITLAPVFEENYEQVEAVTRFHKLFFSNTSPVEIGDVTYQEPNYRYADEHFFEVFDHEFIVGDPATALDEPNNVVITEKIALKYFNTTDALNKTFSYDTIEYVITGVIKDLPPTTHMYFELLGSIYNLPFLQNAIETNSWINPWVYTYVKLKEDTDVANFEAQFSGLVEKFGKASMAERLGANFTEEGHAFNYFLQPLEDIHLKSNLDIELAPNGEIKYIYMLVMVAIIVLIISSINFINLSTARASERAKEVGIRKVMGSLKAGLVYQFLAESIFITFISSIIALALVWIILPEFNTLLGLQLKFDSFMDIKLGTALLAFVLMIGVIAGLYPASVISSMQPATVLKGSFKTSKSGLFIRNILIGVQFFISITMISGAVLVHKQMQFFSSKDLGFQKDNIGYVQVSEAFQTSWDAMRNDLLDVQGIEAVGGNFGLPGVFLGSGVFSVVNNPEARNIRLNSANFDDYFFDVLQFDLIEGRKFTEEFNDSASVIINQSMAKLMGDGPVIGKKIQSTLPESPEFTVVGVVKDYHFKSLHTQISPLAIFNGGGPQYIPAYVTFRYGDVDLQNLITSVEKVWKKHTEQEFAIEFLDDSLMQSYQADLATGKLFDIFTSIAIIMSCIGLFGLATYLLNQKTKEMGIRKVLGAPLPHIVFNFSKAFMMLIGIAFVLAVPLTYYLVQYWLNGFAYSISIGFDTFLLSAGITLLLVIITVSYQTIKLAFLNPTTTLKEN